MSRKNTRSSAAGITIHKPKTKSEFATLNRKLRDRGYIAIDLLKQGDVRDISLALADAAKTGSQDMAANMGCGGFCNGPLANVAWAFDGKTETVVQAYDKDNNKLGDGYVKWGIADNIPSVIPPLALSSPYTAAPLRYIADLTGGLGPRLYYKMPDGSLVEYKDAGDRLQEIIDDLEEAEEKQRQQQQNESASSAEPSVYGGIILPKPRTPDDPLTPKDNQPQDDKLQESKRLKRYRKLYEDWDKSWNGYDVADNPDAPIDGQTTHVPGAKQFLEENNMDLHLAKCMQDNVNLDIYFSTVGLQRGRARRWDYPVKPRIIRVGSLPAHSVRLGTRDDNNYIHNVYYSDSLRKKGALGVQTVSNNDKVDQHFKMYPCAMPDHLLAEIRYQVESHSKGRIKDRPTWIVCPTYYPSGNKPYYPQPAWWSVFTSKAFDFSATILYDKYHQRENNTTWGRILYISLDYLDQVFADEGYQGNPEKQQEFIDALDNSVEQFLQQRENNGKMMRQFMWTGPDGKDHKNVEVVDVKETTNDAVKAGKEELELSTSPIFLALQVDPRLVGVPMVAASNGGTALREMQLLKQQMLSIHQRSYCRFLNAVATYNEWARAEWHIVQQTLTTLDASKTGTVETIAGETTSTTKTTTQIDTEQS